MTQQYPFSADRYTLVGTVTRTHGLRGEIKIAPRYGPPEFFKNYSRVALVATDGRMTAPLKITNCRVQGKKVILKLDTIDTKSEAELTTSMGVLADRDEAAAEPSAAFSGHQLVGLTVWTVDKIRVGVVETIVDNGGQELMVVRAEAEEYLIPFVDEMIVSCDETRLVIDPPPGLLEINLKIKP